MYCTKRINEDLTWVGGCDRKLSMFEGIYPAPRGVSYNSYLLLDKYTVLFDTVDKAVEKVFMENVEHVLDGRNLDYLVIHHMEPDHSATLCSLLTRYPHVKVVCNQKSAVMAKQFFGIDLGERALIVSEGDILDCGDHKLKFFMAPMVHWPEVMMSYDTTDKILFSADAFGCFGGLEGAIFADEVDFETEFMEEARRYYSNIVGKYGPSVQAFLKKALNEEIKMICPLHGFVFRRDIGKIISKYQLWSSYTPEERGVVIAYASVYGNTENAADILASRLRDAGVKTVLFDVSVTSVSDIISAAFRYSHLVFASSTYNTGIFVTMEALLHDLAAHNIQNRTVAFIENGSWAPASGKLMRAIFEPLKNITYISDIISFKSSVGDDAREKIEQLALKIASAPAPDSADGVVDPLVMRKFSYGLFVVTSKADGKHSGCVINTAGQVTDNPKRISVTINKSNYTHDMIVKSGLLNISTLSEKATFDVFKRFGFSSGRDTDKFADFEYATESANGLKYITEYSNSFISAKVISSVDCGTHTIFVADVTEACILSDVPSATYSYYFSHIKPKPETAKKKKGYVCKICGYVYEGEPLPGDFICPICKHGAEDFEPIELNGAPASTGAKS